jgi:hypothetical protein
MNEPSIDAARRMTEAVAALMGALDPAQGAKASFDFGDVSQRTDWAYFPRNHAGLPLLEMQPKQQKLTHALLTEALSLHAYAKVNAIMALESVLNLLERRRADAVRDPGRYFVSVFGMPGSERWGWRFEGHHVCLNFTFLDGAFVSPTPLFLGANPAEVRHGDSTVSRPCAEEEDVARELLLSLDGDQRHAAIICDIAPPDFVLMNVPSVPATCAPGEPGALPQMMQARFAELTPGQREALRFTLAAPKGLPASRMSATQRDLLSRLVDVYLERLPEALARVEREALEREDISALHFAWAGEDGRRRPHYYRLQGPSFLVEYDQTQDEANHVHAVWRHPGRDFGADLLRAHISNGH